MPPPSKEKFPLEKNNPLKIFFYFFFLQLKLKVDGFRLFHFQIEVLISKPHSAPSNTEPLEARGIAASIYI